MRPLSAEDTHRLSAAVFTYGEVGARARGGGAVGYRTLRHDLPVAADPEVALDRLMSWRMHEGAGIRVRAGADRVAPGVVAVLEPGIGPLRLRAPVRVVDVHASGFSYGTLPGHPESGEERFDVVPGPGGCRLVVSGFSRPGRLLTRLAGPIAPRLQDVVVRRYARALAEG